MASTSGRKLNILVEGCCHGELPKIYASVLRMEQVRLMVLRVIFCSVSKFRVVSAVVVSVYQTDRHGPCLVRQRLSTQTVVAAVVFCLRVFPLSLNFLHYFVLVFIYV